MDTAAIALPYGDEAKTAVQKYRDLLKLYTAMQDGRTIYLILGLEVHMWAAWENGINQARNDGFADGEVSGRDSTMEKRKKRCIKR